MLTCAKPNPPKILTEALKRLPGITLLDPALDLKDAPEFDDLKEIKQTSWRTADIDGDGTPDAVAVVVERATTPLRFGVIGILSSKPGEIFWLQSLDPKPLYGVEVVPKSGRIVLMDCIGCDWHSWLRWSGQEFLLGLFSSKDELALSDENIFSEPIKTPPSLVTQAPAPESKRSISVDRNSRRAGT